MYAISGAYRKTSAVSLCVLTGLMPLGLVLEQESIQARVLRLEVSVEGNLDSMFYQPRLNKHQVKPYIKAVEVIDERDLNTKKDIDVFTDGSRTNKGTGFSFCVFQDKTEIYSRGYKLQCDNTVYQSELLAIKESIIWCSKTNFKSFIINSDCQSGIIALKDPDSTNYIVIEIIKLLQSTDKKFFFRWVRGHTGLYGNERADEIAKAATEVEDVLLMKYHPIAPSSLKRTLKKHLLERWQNLWNTEQKSRYTFRLVPKVSQDRIFKHRNLYLFTTNHGPFGKYLSLFKQDITGQCVCGGEADSLHYILNCPLTLQFHLRPPPQDLPLSDWFSTVLECPTLVRKIINCVHFVGQNAFALQGAYNLDRVFE